MDNASYVLFLIIGVALVIADGYIIYRSGRKYLANSYTDTSTAAAMSRLVSVVFHLAVLGLLALISTVDVAADTVMEALVLKLGIVLILLAVAHGITVSIFVRMRDRLDAEELTMKREGRREQNTNAKPVSRRVARKNSAAPATADGPTAAPPLPDPGAAPPLPDPRSDETVARPLTDQR